MCGPHEKKKKQKDTCFAINKLRMWQGIFI